MTPIISYEDGWHIIGDPGEPAFENGWAALGSGYFSPRFRKTKDGLVVVYGTASRAAGNHIGPLFTLPVGYRPVATHQVPMNGYDGVNPVVSASEITAAGVLGLLASVQVVSLQHVYQCVASP